GDAVGSRNQKSAGQHIKNAEGTIGQENLFGSQTVAGSQRFAQLTGIIVWIKIHLSRRGTYSFNSQRRWAKRVLVPGQLDHRNTRLLLSLPHWFAGNVTGQGPDMFRYLFENRLFHHK